MNEAERSAAAELVRRLREEEGFSYAQLGAVYGVHRSTVWRLVQATGKWYPTDPERARLLECLVHRWQQAGWTRETAETRLAALSWGARSRAEEVAWQRSWTATPELPAAIAGPGVGRAREQAALTAALSSWGRDAPRVLLVTGGAGVGKTWLVARVLGTPAVQAQFTGGIYWLSWAGRTPVERWRKLGQQWGLAAPPSGTHETVRWWQERLRPRLARRRVLLVLDGVDEYCDLDEWLVLDAAVGQLLV
ncbi:MAG: AAA family ATPase, partial [Chloroflexota bacterium]|nr:AAA family ATPase [Chloroflexota bacterium]